MEETANMTEKNKDLKSQVNDLKKFGTLEEEVEFLRTENKKLKHAYFVLQGVFPII